MKYKMKISCIAFEKMVTVKQFFLESILKVFMIHFKTNQIPVTFNNLVLMSDDIVSRIEDLPTKDCFQYLQCFVLASCCKAENHSIYFDQLTDKSVIFNYKLYLQKFIDDKDREATIKQMRAIEK